MARTFNGSSQYLSVSSALLTNEPIDIVLIGNSGSITVDQFAVSLGNNGANGGYGIAFRGDIASDPIQVWKFDDTGAGNSGVTASGFVASSYYVGSASFISNTSRSVYINGANKGTNATNVPDPTSDFITIGALRRSTVSSYFNGSIAEVYMLDVNMTDAQHALAGKGISPFWIIPGKNVRAWYPLQGHNNNRVRNGYPDLTATGSPTNGTHPARVFRPRINGVMAV